MAFFGVDPVGPPASRSWRPNLARTIRFPHPPQHSISYWSLALPLNDPSCVIKHGKGIKEFPSAFLCRSSPPSSSTLLPSLFYRRSDYPQCHKPQLEEECKPRCIKFLAAYEACANRIKNDKTGEANCVGQYFDYWSCVDKCVAPKLFELLK